MFTIMGNIKIRFCGFFSSKMGNFSRFEEDGNIRTATPIFRDGHFLFGKNMEYYFLNSIFSYINTLSNIGIYFRV